MKRTLSSLFCVAVATSLTACGGGGVSVSSGLEPVRSAPASAIPSAAASPLATATASALASPTPSAIPTGGASASPTPSPTSSSSTSLTCTDPKSGISNQNWTLDGSPLTITLPPYGTFAGTITFPTNSPTGTVIEEADEQTNFDFAPASTPSDPAFSSRTPDFYLTFRLSQDTTFDMGAATTLPMTILSTCLASGTRYYVDVFAGSTFVNSNSAAASAGQVALDVGVAPNPFPAGEYLNVVLSH